MRNRRLLIFGIVLIVVGIIGLVFLNAMWAQWPWMQGHSAMMFSHGYFD